MKIRLMVSDQRYAELADWLTVHGARPQDDGIYGRLEPGGQLVEGHV